MSAISQRAGMAPWYMAYCRSDLETMAHFRITQAYDAGACIYIYYAFNYKNVDHPMETYERVEVWPWYAMEMAPW